MSGGKWNKEGLVRERREEVKEGRLRDARVSPRRNRPRMPRTVAVSVGRAVRGALHCYQSTRDSVAYHRRYGPYTAPPPQVAYRSQGAGPRSVTTFT